MFTDVYLQLYLYIIFVYPFRDVYSFSVVLNEFICYSWLINYRLIFQMSN